MQGPQENGHFWQVGPFSARAVCTGGNKEMKTKVIKKNLNPVFDEVFKCKVSLLCLTYVCFIKDFFMVLLTAAKTLTTVFRVFDWDMIKDGDNIGEVIDHKSIVEAESLNFN